MREFSKARIAITLTGAEWTVLLARLINRELSPQGAKIYNDAAGKLKAQLLRASEACGPNQKEEIDHARKGA